MRKIVVLASLVVAAFFIQSCKKQPIQIFTEGRIDNTHFLEEGALLMDSLFIAGLKEQNIEPLLRELK